MVDEITPTKEELPEIMERFTSLNNELLDAKRELVKRNIELDRLQQELQAKNLTLKNLNEELEMHVSNRTKQLSLALNEIDDFAYSMSHDLRTPLRGIDGYSSMLMEDYKDKLDEQAIRYLRSIRNDAQRLGIVLDALNGLCKVSSKDIALVQTDLSEMAEQIANQQIAIFPDRKIEFVVQPGMMDLCDRDLMHTALTNLFANAIKFSKQEENAKVQFGMASNEGCRTYFVKDNGIGFNMDYVNKLFHNFQRLHHYNDFEGIGIGLATVRRVIVKHGGSIHAESAPGNGATFFFTLACN
ncbi:MAG: ATP-binding protein [Candidatus Cloacimonetes bacterium]|nr:ATP-binding protein [Candidatus Cloacimonadota bacterium]